MPLEIGRTVPDLAFGIGPGSVRRLSGWGDRPLVLIFLRHLA
jgi:hypothetical protein